MGIYKLWSRGLPFIMLDKDTDIIFMADEMTFEAKSDSDSQKTGGTWRGRYDLYIIQKRKIYGMAYAIRRHRFQKGNGRRPVKIFCFEKEGKCWLPEKALCFDKNKAEGFLIFQELKNRL